MYLFFHFSALSTKCPQLPPNAYTFQACTAYKNAIAPISQSGKLLFLNRKNPMDAKCLSKKFSALTKPAPNRIQIRTARLSICTRRSQSHRCFCLTSRAPLLIEKCHNILLCKSSTVPVFSTIFCLQNDTTSTAKRFNPNKKAC